MSGFARKASYRAIGEIYPHAGTTRPKNALVMNGRLWPESLYPKLAEMLGSRSEPGNVIEVDGMFRVPGYKDALPQQANQLRHDFLTYDSIGTLTTITASETGYSHKMTLDVEAGTSKYLHRRFPRIVSPAAEAGQYHMLIPFRIEIQPNGTANGIVFNINVGLCRASGSFTNIGSKLDAQSNYLQFEITSNISSVSVTAARLVKCIGGVETIGFNILPDVIKEPVGDGWNIDMGMMYRSGGLFSWRNSDGGEYLYPDEGGTFNALGELDVCPMVSYEQVTGGGQIQAVISMLYDNAMASDVITTLRPYTVPPSPGSIRAVNLCDWPEYQTGLGPDTTSDDEAGQQYQNAWWSPLMTYDPTYLNNRRNELFLWCIQAK